MSYDVNKPADSQYIAQGPGDIRANTEALRTGAIVNAGTLNGLSNSNDAGQIPVSNGTVNTNLNADLLDGQHGSYYAAAAHTHAAVTTSSNGFMVSTDKAKLDGIAAGAQVNQNAFGNVSVGSTTIQADSVTDTLTLTPGYGVTLTADAVNDAVTVAITNDGTNASHGHAAATAGAAGFISASDKSKLDGIAAGAEVNQMAFSTIVAGGASAVADSKSDTFTLNASAGISITGDAANNACSIAVTQDGHSHAAATTGAAGFMSTTDKAKLDGIAAAAEVNQMAFSNVLVGGTTIAADSKTDTLELAAGTNITLTPDATNDKVTINVTGAVATAGTCTGNAATATKLATARTLSLTGDATGSLSFDGSANASGALTLAASGATAGTYKSVTVDAKGRVTAGANPTTLAGYGITDAVNSSTGNAPTATKLQTARTINGVSFDGSANITIPMTVSNGLPDCILNGMKISLATTALQAGVSTGRAIIGENEITFDTANTLLLSARSTNLIYATNSGTIGSVVAAFPAVDTNTVAQWIITGASSIANTAVAVNGNTIAVANALTKTGTISQVDGWVGYGGQNDGSTGYYTPANTTGFPTGSSVKEMDFLVTIGGYSGTPYLVGYGGGSGTGGNFLVFLSSSGNISFDIGNYIYDTGYTVVIGQTYFISLLYDGTKYLAYVNGSLIYTLTNTGATGVADGFNIFKKPGNNINSDKNTIHLVEIRNALRTPTQLGTIANKLCLPCSYTAYSASYPTISSIDLASAYHEYKFDETSGTTVTDSKGTLSGTVTGTTIVDSPIGLGKARNFNGTASDYITAGSYTFSPTTTVIAVLTKRSGGSGGRLLGSSDGSGVVFSTGEGSTAKPGFYNGSTWYNANTVLPFDKPVFLAYTLTANNVTFYIESPQPDITVNAAVSSKTFGALRIGRVWDDNYIFNGILDYLIIIPRTLSQAEIAQYYNAFMTTITKNTIDDMCPADSILLGYARTNSSQIIEFDSDSYKYGRREGITGGNRKVFLGWKYFSGSSYLSWNNPFSTRKIKTYYTWAQNANGSNEVDIIGQLYDGVSWHGLQNTNTSSQRISALTQPAGVTSFNGAWQTSGYIGCYAEVIE